MELRTSKSQSSIIQLLKTNWKWNSFQYFKRCKSIRKKTVSFYIYFLYNPPIFQHRASTLVYITAFQISSESYFSSCCTTHREVHGSFLYMYTGRFLKSNFNYFNKHWLQFLISECRDIDQSMLLNYFDP